MQTDGSRAPLMRAPDRDSAIAASYRQAGMVLLGKTSSPEFGEPLDDGAGRTWPLSQSLGHHADNRWIKRGFWRGGRGPDGRHRGRQRRRRLDPDPGILLRCLFGLKPSRGRICSSPYPGDSLFGLATGHALTRSVRDSAALLDVSSGSKPGDPTGRRRPGPSLRRGGGRRPRAPPDRRIDHAPDGRCCPPRLRHRRRARR